MPQDKNMVEQTFDASDNLDSSFHEAMIQIYKTALEECDYRAKAFLAMVVELGGLRAAQRLLAAADIQSGLYELHRCGRLDLTVETLVLAPEYVTLFTDEELAEARQRIDMLSQ